MNAREDRAGETMRTHRGRLRQGPPTRGLIALLVRFGILFLLAAGVVASCFDWGRT